MQTSKPTVREVYEKKRLAAERKRAAEERRVAKESGAAEPSGARKVVPEAATPAVSGIVETDVVDQVPTDPPVEAASQAIVALPARDKASGKRPQVDDSEEKRRKKKKKK